MDDSVLVSLAILHVNWSQRGQSYVDGFVPFVAQCLKDAPHDEISLDDLRSALLARYGIDIPLGGLNLIVRRAAKHNYVTRREGIVVRHLPTLQSLHLETTRASFLRQHQALLASFAEFTEKRGIHLTTEEAELAYISANSLPILRKSLRGTAFSSTSPPDRHDALLAAAFIAYAAESDPATFGYLDTIVKGSILATALFLPDPSNQRRRVDNLTVYFDTPVILGLLGLHGNPERDAVRELISLLRAIGARLACFDDTLSECQAVMQSCAGELRRLGKADSQAGSFRALRYAIDQGISSSEMELLAEDLERTLRLSNIQVLAHPGVPQTGDYLSEAALEQRVREDILYRNENALLHDVSCLSAIERLRRGRPQRSIDRAVAVFVTTNTALALTSRSFFGEEGHGDRVPVCATVSELAAVVWLKNPVAAPDLPRKIVMAECYAALEPADPLWHEYLVQVDQIEASGRLLDEDYVFLRYSLEAKRSLTDVSLEDGFEISPGSVAEILRRAKEMANKEEHDRGLAIEKSAAEREASFSDQIKVLQSALSDQALAERRQRQHSLERLQAMADRAGLVAFWGVVFVLGSVAIAAAALTIFGSTTRFRIWFGALFVVVIVGGMLSISHLTVGVTLRDIARRVQESITRRTNVWLTRHFGPGPETPAERAQHDAGAQSG